MACYICEYPSVLKCRQCGKSVCGRHYDYSDGKCTDCHDKQYPKAAEVETKPAFIPEVKPAQPKARKGRK